MRVSYTLLIGVEIGTTICEGNMGISINILNEHAQAFQHIEIYPRNTHARGKKQIQEYLVL